MYNRGLHRRLCNSPLWSFITISGVIYFLIIIYLQPKSQRDPSSVFFVSNKAYRPAYSAARRKEAHVYMESVSNGLSETRIRYSPANREHALCLGIASVARHQVRYFKSTVGSLLEGLTSVERQGIFLVLFVANSDPYAHPAVAEDWMNQVADQVLFYNGSQTEHQYVVDMEHRDAEHREKPLFDYRHLLDVCIGTELPYIAMLEDDVIAMDGWYHRTIQAIAEAELQTALRYRLDHFLYLRLFFTEQFLGWNAENWKTYLVNSLLAFALLSIGLLVTRTFVASTRKFLRNDILLVVCFVHLPLAILMFFAAGRMTVLPLSQGVIEMDNYGCCSQGLVFPRTIAIELSRWYAEKTVRFVDVLTEAYGDLTGLPRWSVSPSVLQHVGTLTSKSDSISALNEEA